MNLPPLPWSTIVAGGRHIVIDANGRNFMDIAGNYHPQKKIAEFICDAVNNSQWVSVVERLPDNGNLVFFVRAGMVYRGQRQEGYFEYNHHRYYDQNHDVTDWMYSPTPAPPAPPIPKGPTG